jgi:HSP20 family protein
MEVPTMTETMIREEKFAPSDYFTPYLPRMRDFFDVFDLDSFFTWPRYLAEGMAMPMRIEQFVEKGYLVVRAELPGIDPEKDLHLTFEYGGFRITAERRKDVDVRPPAEYFTEMKYGKWSRFFALPKGVTIEAVKATYKNGILEVRVALPEEAPVKASTTIPIKY